MRTNYSYKTFDWKCLFCCLTWAWNHLMVLQQDSVVGSLKQDVRIYIPNVAGESILIRNTDAFIFKIFQPSVCQTRGRHYFVVPKRQCQDLLHFNPPLQHLCHLAFIWSLLHLFSSDQVHRLGGQDQVSLNPLHATEKQKLIIYALVCPQKQAAD